MRKEVVARKEMIHFSHCHELYLFEKSHRIKYDPVWCLICEEEILDPIYYYCSKSCKGFILHITCANVYEEIRHPFHPKHPLFLCPTSREDNAISCSSCGQDCPLVYYHCSLCNFNLDIRCTHLMPDNKNGDLEVSGEVELSSHPHPLFICRIVTFFTNYWCSCCRTQLRRDGRIYVCLQCKALLHESCTEVPPKIHHSLHPSHPLTLVRGRFEWFRCFSCDRNCQGYSYNCVECRFHLDPLCASLMPTKDLVQLSHPHPLFRFETNKDKIPTSCRGCRETLSVEDPVFFCSECRIWLHKSCAELSKEIRHPLDSQHHLTLIENYDAEKLPKRRDCFACCKSIPGFLYHCSHCKLMIDSKCASSITASFKSTVHPHSIAVFQKDTTSPTFCYICGQTCNPPFFRCLQCKFNYHVYCFPKLPPAVKSIRHRHHLSFTCSQIKDYPDEDHDDDFYCDDCEELRDLNDPTYYCVECHYVAHVHCTLSQVMSFLEEDYWPVAQKLEEKFTGQPVHGEGDDLEKENATANGKEVLNSPTPVQNRDYPNSRLDQIDKKVALVLADKESMKAKLEEVQKIIKELEIEYAQHNVSTTAMSEKRQET